MSGDWIDLDSFLPTIKDAARRQPAVGWVAWVFGIVATALGAIPPPHWVLLGIGLLLLVAAAVNLIRTIIDRRDSRRISKLPPLAIRGDTDERRPQVHVRIDVPDHEAPPSS